MPTKTKEIAWTCSHGCAYTEEELEAGFSFMYMDWWMEQERLEYELEADLEHEAMMARALAYSMEPEFATMFRQYELHEAVEAADIPWPWYADSPVIEIQPQEFTPYDD